MILCRYMLLGNILVQSAICQVRWPWLRHISISTNEASPDIYIYKASHKQVQEKREKS